MQKTNAIVRWELDRQTIAFSTTRHGGYSEGEFGEFNMNPWVGDNPEHVEKNRQMLARQLCLGDASCIIMPHQVHGTRSLQITSDFLNLTPEAQAALLEGIDIVMTDVPSVCIGVSTADCVPILLYDMNRHAAVAIHAGWRGTKERIVEKAFNDMHRAYGSDAQQMRAIIGPCIQMHNYEVGHDVWQQFYDAGFNMKSISLPETQRKKQPDNPEERKYTLDLCLANHQLLQDLGFESHHIFASLRNSYGEADDFFSVRRQGPNCGRTYTGIIL